MNDVESYDVIVVGGGNAALCAALSAREGGARVALLERASEAERGGNSSYTGGSMRLAFDSVDVIHDIVPDLSQEEIANTDFGTYPEARFFDDLYKVTQFHTDPELSEVLIKHSQQAVRWLSSSIARWRMCWRAPTLPSGSCGQAWMRWPVRPSSSRRPCSLIW